MGFSYWISDAGDPAFDWSHPLQQAGVELPDDYCGVFLALRDLPDQQQLDIWLYVARVSPEALMQLLTSVYGEGWGLCQPTLSDTTDTIVDLLAARAATLARAREFLEGMPPASTLALVAVDNS